MISDEVTLRIKIKGASPLIMHSASSADPQNYWAKKMGPLKAKRKKTDADIQEIRELSFLSSLYWSEELESLYMPAENVRKMLLEAGRALDQKNAKKQIVGIRFETHLGWPLNIKNANNLEALRKDDSLKYIKLVTIAKAKVVSVRSIFSEWEFEMDIIVDRTILDPKTVEEWFDYAGKRVGLCARRPYGPTPGEFGKFYVKSIEEIK